jgi:hypothetical protein
MKKIYEDLNGAYNDGLKPKRDIPWLAWCIAAVCVLWATGAFAQQTTYVYSGTLLDQPTQDGSSYISGQITLPTPLPANGTTTVTNAISWSFDGQLMLNSDFIPQLGLFPNGDAYGQTASFTFTTVNGVIMSWNVSVTGSVAWGNTTGSESMGLSMSGDTDSYLIQDGYCSFNENCSPIVVSNNHHGSWVNGLAQVAADKTNYDKLMADYQSMMLSRNTYQSDYTAASAEIAKLTAQVATCRAKAGKC